MAPSAPVAVGPCIKRDLEETTGRPELLGELPATSDVLATTSSPLAMATRHPLKIGPTAVGTLQRDPGRPGSY